MSKLLHHYTNAVRLWYLPLLFGIVFIIFGAYVFVFPLETYLSLSFLFSLSFLISGFFDLIFFMRNCKILKGWSWHLISGILSSAMGIYLLAYPEISTAMLPFIVGFTLLFRSFQLLGFSFELKDTDDLNWGNLAIASILGIIFSFLLLANPVFIGLSLITLTAMSFIIVGLASVLLSFGLKKLKEIPGSLSDELKAKIKQVQTEINRELR